MLVYQRVIWFNQRKWEIHGDLTFHHGKLSKKHHRFVLRPVRPGCVGGGLRKVAAVAACSMLNTFLKDDFLHLKGKKHFFFFFWDFLHLKGKTVTVFPCFPFLKVNRPMGFPGRGTLPRLIPERSCSFFPGKRRNPRRQELIGSFDVGEFQVSWG